MIQLKPIHPIIQNTLQEKIKTSGKEDKSLEDSRRTVWSRMISLSVPHNDETDIIASQSAKKIVKKESTVESKPIVISGGEEDITLTENADNDALATKTINGKLKSGFDSIYDTNNYYRPTAGIKNIDTSIQGDFKAIRKVKINWVCWDFETLTRLTPYFLHPGKSVAVEWGWMGLKHKPHNFVYNNWSEINASFIGSQYEKNIELGKGHQEFLYGVISNFNWTGRDDGGFDCSTELVSVANNIFGQPLGDSNENGKFELTEDMRKQVASFRSVLRPKTEKLIFSSELQKVKESEIMEKLIENIPPIEIFRKLRETLCVIKFEGAVSNMGGPKTKIKKVSDGSLYIDTGGASYPEYNNTIIAPIDTEGLRKIRGPYITYGWFEDNILNRIVGQVASTSGGEQLIRKVRSVDYWGYDNKTNEDLYVSVKIRNDRKNLQTMNAEEVIIPGQFPYIYQLQKDKKIKTAEGKKRKFNTTKQLYTAQRNLVPFAVTPEVSEKEQRKRNIMNLDTKKSLVGEQEYGYLRNLLINSKIIEEEFLNANTIDDGLNNLLKRISDACGGVWNFKLTTDGDTAKVIEVGSTEGPVRDLIRNKSLNITTGKINENYKNDGLMVFPVWKKNSIVYNQEMTSRIPSEMAASIAYGNNLSSFEASNEDETLNRAGVKLGQIMRGENKDKVLNQTERIFGNKQYDNFGLNLNIGKKTNEWPYPNHIPKITLNDGISIDSKRVGAIIVEPEIANALKTESPTEEDTAERKLTEKITKDSIKQKYDADYTYLYDGNGKMRRQFKEAMLYFLKGFPISMTKKEDPIVPIDLSVTIDGTGGIFAGECFTSSYLPKKYLDTTIYQIMNVSHQVSADSWKTTLTGKMRIDNTLNSTTTPTDMFMEVYNNKDNKLDPPYINFVEYLEATQGKKSPYSFDLEEDLELRIKRDSDVETKSNIRTFGLDAL